MIEILTSKELSIMFLNIILGSIAIFTFVGAMALIEDWVRNLRR